MINAKSSTIFCVIAFSVLTPCFLNPSHFLNLASFRGAIAQEGNQQLEFAKLGQISTGGDAYDLWINEEKELAYVSCGYSGLRIFNVSSYTKPVELSHLPEQRAIIPTGHTTGYAHQFFLDNNDHIYVGDGAGGLTIINCSDPFNSRLISQYLGGYAWDVQKVGDIAYVALGWIDESLARGIDILNVSQPSNPLFLSNYSTHGLITDLEVEGNLLFLSDSHAGLLILNISNFTNPTLVGQYEDLATGDPDCNFDVVDDLAYLASWTNGFRIINISDPANILVMSEYESNENYFSLKIFEDLAFLCAKQGLAVLNVSDPSTPVVIGNYYDEGRVNSIYKKGDILFLANEENGLGIFHMKGRETSKSEDTSAYEMHVVFPVILYFIIRRKVSTNKSRRRDT